MCEGGERFEMEKLYGFRHLFMTVFLYNLATFMVVPAITDITMAALCPDEMSAPLPFTSQDFNKWYIYFSLFSWQPNKTVVLIIVRCMKNKNASCVSGSLI